MSKILFHPQRKIPVFSFLANDWAITRRRFNNTLKFINNYWAFRRLGRAHKQAATDARNTF